MRDMNCLELKAKNILHVASIEQIFSSKSHTANFLLNVFFVYENRFLNISKLIDLNSSS